jgi:hypothetical protein
MQLELDPQIDVSLVWHKPLLEIPQGFKQKLQVALFWAQYKQL